MARTWENAVITNEGAALMHGMYMAGNLNISSIKAGAGQVAVSALKAQTAVSQIKQTGTLQSINSNGYNAKISVLFENTGLTSSYILRQVGIYVTGYFGNEVLFAIAQATTGREIPSAEESPGYSCSWEFNIVLSNEVNITAAIEPAGLATVGALAELKEELEAEIGDLDDLETTSKGSAVEAINEVNQFYKTGNLPNGALLVGSAEAVKKSGAEVVYGNTNNATRIKGTSITATQNIQVDSDERLKIVETIDTEALREYARKIKLIAYTLKTDEKQERHLGVTAQQLIDIDKEIAKYFVFENPETGYYSVDYVALALLGLLV